MMRQNLERYSNESESYILLKLGFCSFAQITLCLFVENLDQLVVSLASFDVDLLLGGFDVANIDSPSSDAVYLLWASY